MKTKLKKMFFRIGIILAILLVLGLAVRAVFNYTNGKKLDKTLDKLKAEVHPLTLKDIEPLCEDENNAALYWKAAEALITLEAEERRILVETINDIFHENILGAEKIEHLNKIIESQAKAVQLFREAAAMPCFKYANNYTGSAANLKLPNAVKLITIFRVFGISTVLQAKAGQGEAAIEDFLSGIQFLRLYLREPWLINHLIRIANIKQLFACLQPVITQNEIPTPLLQKVMKELDYSPWREGLIWSFKTERVYNLDIMNRVLSGDVSDLDGSFDTRFGYWIIRPILKSEIIWMLKQWDKVMDLAQRPYYEVASMDEEFQGIWNSIPKFYTIVELLFPNVIASMFKSATLEAMLETARIGIACKIYKNQTGKFPETIAQLIPDILDQEPLDPFTGKPFVFKRNEDGFLVYSLGSNKKDDGGRGTWKITSIVMDKADDWFWKENYNIKNQP